MLKKYFLLVLILSSYVNIMIGQDDAHVFGKVAPTENRDLSISDAKILIKKDGKSFKIEKSDNNGEFDFRLDLDYKYELYFSKKGFVTKWIVIDTQSIPEADKEGGFDMKIDMSLFQKRKNLDASCLQKPIGIMHYYSENNALDWDFSHTENIKGELNIAHSIADSLNKPQFDILINKGDLVLQKGNKKKAEKFYLKAQLLIPTNELVAEKLRSFQAPVKRRSGVRV